MVSERAIKNLQLDPKHQRALTPDITIPEDTKQNRLVFKSVPGMTKYLSKQYKGMMKKEE